MNKLIITFVLFALMIWVWSCYFRAIPHLQQVGVLKNFQLKHLDDFSGEYMISPMCKPEDSRVKSVPIYIGKHTVVGTGSVILPGACIREGVALGAMTLLKTDTKEYSIYVGNPAKYLRQRHDRCKQLAESYE